MWDFWSVQFLSTQRKKHPWCLKLKLLELARFGNWSGGAMPPIPVALSGYTHDTFFFVAPDTFLSNFRKSVRLTCACRWLLDCFLKVGVTGAFFSLYGKMPFLKEILKYQKKKKNKYFIGHFFNIIGRYIIIS